MMVMINEIINTANTASRQTPNGQPGAIAE